MKTAPRPRLRFPEFRDGPPWNVEPMESLYAFGRTNSLSRAQLNSHSGDVKNVHYGDIHTKYPSSLDLATVDVPYINSTEALPEPNSGDYCVEGDLIFADASEDTKDVGKCVEVIRLHGQRLLAGQHTILARRKQPNPAIGFGGHLFQSPQIRSQIMRESQGTKVYSISPSRLASIEIAYPGDEGEQEKITECLMSLDSVIAVQGRKVEALKTYKRGLIQQLFPRDGEVTPRLRLLKKKVIHEWTSARFGDLLQKSSVAVDVEPARSYREIGIRSHGKGVFHKSPVAGGVLGEKRVFQVVENALVINIVFAWEQAVATTSVSEAGMIASHRFPMFLPKSGACDVRYVKAYLLTKAGKHKLGLASPGGAGRNKTLDHKELNDLRLPVPPSVEEQTAIANCLAAIDASIALEVRKLNSLSQHKAGLMQQLFPSPREI